MLSRWHHGLALFHAHPPPGQVPHDGRTAHQSTSSVNQVHFDGIGAVFFPFLKSGQLREELFSLRGDHMPTLARGVRHQEALLVQPIPSFHHTSRDLGLTGPVFIPRRSRPYTLVLVLKHAEEVIAIQPPILLTLACIDVEMYEEKVAEMR